MFTKLRAAIQDARRLRALEKRLKAVDPLVVRELETLPGAEYLRMFKARADVSAVLTVAAQPFGFGMILLFRSHPVVAILLLCVGTALPTTLIPYSIAVPAFALSPYIQDPDWLNLCCANFLLRSEKHPARYLPGGADFGVPLSHEGEAALRASLKLFREGEEGVAFLDTPEHRIVLRVLSEIGTEEETGDYLEQFAAATAHSRGYDPFFVELRRLRDRFQMRTEERCSA